MSIRVIKEVFRHGTLLMAMLSLSGCMVGPDYARPETHLEDVNSFVNAPEDWPRADELEPVGKWWLRFDDAVTNEIVELAIANNNNLKEAAARVVESRAVYEIAWGRRLPDISYGGARRRGVILPGTRVGNFYTQNLTISWVADIFGKLKRGQRAAADDLLAEEFNQEALVHAVIAQAVSSRVRIATDQRLVKIAESNTASRKQTLDIVERRYNSGLTSSLSLHLAKENLAAAASTKPVAEQSLALSVYALDVLLGRRPGTAEVPEDTLGKLPELGPIPMSIPAWLLDRRPDVKRAEMQLAAATERVGVSIADMYPDLTFTAIGGYASGSYRLSTATGNQIYSAIISLAAPIYKGGSLKAGVKAAKARAEQAAARYADVVLRAIREVEGSLVREQKTSERVALLQERFNEAMIADNLARQRYSQGLSDTPLLVVLETERRRIIAENELALVTENLFNARIDLFLALGGDWSENPKNEIRKTK